MARGVEVLPRIGRATGGGHFLHALVYVCITPYENSWAGWGLGEFALANVLVLAVLVDDGESSPGALGKFVEILVGTRLHQRDAVDLDAL